MNTYFFAVRDRGGQEKTHWIKCISAAAAWAGLFSSGLDFSNVGSIRLTDIKAPDGTNQHL